MRAISKTFDSRRAARMQSAAALLPALAALLWLWCGRAHANPGSPQEAIESLCRRFGSAPCITRVAASVRGAESGIPLSGKRLRFVAGDTVICSSVTDASGRAACFGVAPSGRTLAESGYRILFDGDERFHAGGAVVRTAFRNGAQSSGIGD